MPTTNKTYRLEDSRLLVIIDPAYGGKIRSLVSQRSGREYLYQDPRTSFAGPGYSDHDITGMDECFPTVSPGNYPHGRWQGLALGDHGWLWDRPWRVESGTDLLTAAIELTEAPIHFERTCRLVARGQLQLEYAIENRANEPFEFLYANHLLLNADSSTRIDYPDEMRQAYVYLSYYMDDVTDGAWINWPPQHALGVTEPLDSHRGNLIKLFSPRLQRGEVAISHDEHRESLRIEFDVDHLPHLGILLAQGFGPTERDWRGLFVGLEATTGIGDDLASCRATNSSVQLQPAEIFRFQIKLSLIQQLL